MIEQRCVEKGLRMTEQRRVIARVLSGAEDHPDAEELHRRAAAKRYRFRESADRLMQILFLPSRILRK